jgi:hypothetical protein
MSSHGPHPGRPARPAVKDVARLDGEGTPLATHVVATGLTARGSGEIRPTAMAGLG